MVTLKYMNLLLQLYTPSKCQIYNKWTVHEHKCLFFSFVFLQIERERGGYTKFGIRRHSPKGTYFLFFFFFFLMEFLWRIFPLLRVNRLYAIFNTGLKNLGPSCPRYFFVFFTRSTGFWSVCHEPCPITNFSYYLFLLTGGSPHFRFRVPANRLASTFPCQATRVRSPSINIWSPLWPIFFLNGHSLMASYS